MYFCLVIALLATFLWINILSAENTSAKTMPYSTPETKDADEKRAKIKTYLVIIMSIFWAAVIYFM